MGTASRDGHGRSAGPGVPWWCQSAPVFRCGRRTMTAPTPKNRSPDAAPRP